MLSLKDQLQSMKFNEDSRVKIPALLHLIRLGYEYIPVKNQIRIKEKSATPLYNKPNFNYFIENKDYHIMQQSEAVPDDVDNALVKDNNLMVIKHSPEYITNKQDNITTNRILSSLFSKERLQFLLKYAIGYVKDENIGKIVYQKHIIPHAQNPIHENGKQLHLDFLTFKI